VEDFVLCEDSAIRDQLPACEHHFIRIRSALARFLWSREYYIGVSVLDSLLFQAVGHSATNDPLRWTLETIRDLGLHRPGFVLYPLHSIGFLGAGLLRAFTRSQLQFTLDRYGLAITPQTNSFERTVAFIDAAAEMLGIGQRAPKDLLEHWRRSRPTEWLERNPLLLLRVSSFPGDYYENQFLFIARLKFATSLVFLLSTLQPASDGSESKYVLSSSSINNWQTLDLHHYFVFYPRPGRGRTLNGDCVPTNVHGATLAELSELAVELDPRHWQRRSNFVDRFCRALRGVETSYTAYAMRRGKNRVRARVARKLFNALMFFRRSFRQSGDSIDAVVNLAAAFEILLTDSYAPGVQERILRRLDLALRGVKGRSTMVQALEKLYESRSAYVHAGESSHAVNIQGGRAAFARGFLAVAERLDRLPIESGQPIGEILGDSS
jgi:hypothetical protein